ncbi:MAG: WD40/YVTN/BNR-like repeat-containing protein [Allomuricauda sp.]
MKNFILTSVFLLTFLTNAQITKETISNISFRNIGPGFMTGRIADIEKDPNNPSIWYVAVASGNVWKTENNGTTWKPIFENYGSFSTGCLAIDPNNSGVIWLGTGENQSQRSVGWGDGVYKSLDYGKSWTNVGLKKSEHIGKIVIDPQDSNTVYVAAQGPLWKEGGDRGLYKTQDGGKTWKPILQVSENTGISDIVMDPNDSNTLYTVSYQRRRHVGILIGGGPETGMYKSIDAGNTWKKLTSGLPSSDWGRPALAISPQKSNVLYAQIPGKDENNGGFYRSSDAGENWTKMSNYTVVDPQYYGEIYPDPNRFDHVYTMDVRIHHTTDGGKTFARINMENMHGDIHEMMFNESNPDYLMTGGDGGIYESWDFGRKWKYHSNLPITQFYRVGIDNVEPFYNVYGGTQDNSTLYAAVRNTTRHGISNRDWKMLIGGDGFQVRVDPEDPNIAYGQYQYAGIVRYDKRTGQRIDIQPQPSLDDDPLRWHWDSPLVLSPHNSKRLYYAAQRIFMSNDRGDSWQPISEDLSRGENRNNRKVMGKVWPPEAVYKNVFTSPYGTIVSLSESPIKEGLLVAGTDDGLIQITENGGTTWRAVPTVKGVPQKAYVADVLTSNHDTNTIYAVFNNHKEGDFKPYFAKSTDLGRTWSLITSGIGASQAGWCIVEDHVDPNLLFAATEFGLFASINGGNSWEQMKGGLPTIGFRDLEIQQRENDLVAASFGRGFYVLDDYAPLRDVKNASESHLFPIKDTWQFFQRGDIGYSRRGSLGADRFSADNPKYGAKIRLHLKKNFPSLAAQRKRNPSSSDAYPTAETLQKEDFEDDIRVFIRINNSNNKNIAMVPVANRKGFQEVYWDLSTQVKSENIKYSRTLNFVPEGTYTAQLMVFQAGKLTELGKPQNFKVTELDITSEKPAADRFAFYANVAKLSMAAEKLEDELNETIKLIERKKQTFMVADKKDDLQSLEEKHQELLQLEYQLLGNETKRKRFQYYLPGIKERIERVLGAHWETSQITQTQRDNLKLAENQLKKIQNRYQELKLK